MSNSQLLGIYSWRCRAHLPAAVLLPAAPSQPGAGQGALSDVFICDGTWALSCQPGVRGPSLHIPHAAAGGTTEQSPRTVRELCCTAPSLGYPQCCPTSPQRSWGVGGEGGRFTPKGKVAKEKKRKKKRQNLQTQSDRKASVIQHCLHCSLLTGGVPHMGVPHPPPVPAPLPLQPGPHAGSARVFLCTYFTSICL